jgi:hypothetical protein
MRHNPSIRVLLPLVGMLALTHAALAQLVNENLLVTIPPGYKIDFKDRKPDRLINEMVPEDQTVGDWTEMVTVQIFYGLKATPEAFENRVADGWLKACPGATTSSIVSGPENGYPAGVWLLNCPRNPATGKPEITWTKVMAGNDSLYVVQKAFKFAPSRDQITPWMKYLRDVAVCDSRLPDRACPQVRN